MRFTKGCQSLCSYSYFDTCLSFRLLYEYMEPGPKTRGILFAQRMAWGIYLQLLNTRKSVVEQESLIVTQTSSVEQKPKY